MDVKMKEIIGMTFGGISKSYYFRQFFFAALFTAFFLWFSAKHEVIEWWYIVYVMMALIYPYAKYAFDTVADFIIGDNVLIYSAPWFGLVKLASLILCYCFGFLIAPIGLLMIYYAKKKQNNQS